MQWLNYCLVPLLTLAPYRCKFTGTALFTQLNSEFSLAIALILGFPDCSYFRTRMARVAFTAPRYGEITTLNIAGFELNFQMKPAASSGALT